MDNNEKIDIKELPGIMDTENSYKRRYSLEGLDYIVSLLVSILNKDPNILYSGHSKKHPLSGVSEIYIESKKPYYPKDILHKKIEEIVKILNGIIHNIENSK